MKRFYCTVCKQVKRVQSLPSNVEFPNSEIPEDRIGQCAYHSYASASRKSINDRERIIKTVKKVKPEVKSKKSA